MWLNAALHKDGGSRSRERMRALSAAASLALAQGDHGIAEASAQECLELATDLGDEAWRQHALYVLGHATHDLAQAQAYMEERMAGLRKSGDTKDRASALSEQRTVTPQSPGMDIPFLLTLSSHRICQPAARTSSTGNAGTTCFPKVYACAG